jgi:hypothetical protein
MTPWCTIAGVRRRIERSLARMAGARRGRSVCSRTAASGLARLDRDTEDARS